MSSCMCKLESQHWSVDTVVSCLSIHLRRGIVFILRHMFVVRNCCSIASEEWITIVDYMYMYMYIYMYTYTCIIDTCIDSKQEGTYLIPKSHIHVHFLLVATRRFRC